MLGIFTVALVERIGVWHWCVGTCKMLISESKPIVDIVVSSKVTIVSVSNEIKTTDDLMAGTNTTTECRMCIVDARVYAADLFNLCRV